MRAQRGNCGGPFRADLGGALVDGEGRTYVRSGDACGSLGSLHTGAEDEPLYRCPVALAAAAWASPAAAVHTAVREGGIPLAAKGYAAPLSEGTADGAHAMAAAWLWRQRIDAEARRAEQEARRHG